MLRVFLCLICFNVNAMDISTTLEKYSTQIPLSTQQLILVKALHNPVANVYTLQRNGYIWEQVLPTITANIGSKGISYNKIEGDNKTPAGLFPFGTAFGNEYMTLKVNYRQITTIDKFIDDPNDPKYNQWVHGATTANSYEKMLRDDGIYKYGIVINYNMNPIIKGRGSAVFMHIWYGYNIASIGCVTVSAENMLKILQWLDSSLHPYILITK